MFFYQRLKSSHLYQQCLKTISKILYTSEINLRILGYEISLKVQDLVKICKGQLASVLVPTAIIMEWRKENRCFLSIHKAFNFSMYSDLSLSISLSLSLSPFSLYISKFPFYIQRHYRKAFNSSHNVLCIWILKEEMETFFAAAFTPPEW